MNSKTYDFYARSLDEQEIIITNLPRCHHHPPTNFVEYHDENGLTTVEAECPECSKRCKVQFMALRDLD